MSGQRTIDEVEAGYFLTQEVATGKHLWLLIDLQTGEGFAWGAFRHDTHEACEIELERFMDFWRGKPPHEFIHAVPNNKHYWMLIDRQSGKVMAVSPNRWDSTQEVIADMERFCELWELTDPQIAPDLTEENWDKYIPTRGESREDYERKCRDVGAEPIPEGMRLAEYLAER